MCPVMDIGWGKMATANVALPPMGKISIIVTWIETVLYGVNCVVYGLCMFILLRGRRTHDVRWVLLVTSTLLFLLCTIHVGVSLQQLLEAFVYAPADVPDYSTMYWLNYTTTLNEVKNNMYNGLVFTQDFILIWRLYVVFMNDWRVIILPILLEAACVGTVYATMGMAASANFGLSGSALLSSLTISVWTLGLVLNVSVTVAIVTRLWWKGRTLGSLTATRTNQYASSIYILVESGAIFAATAIAMLAIYASHSIAGMVFALDIASQLAALTPLLVVVRAGQAGRYNIPKYDSSKTVLTELDEATFRMRAPRGQDSAPQDISLRSMSRSPSSVHVAHF